MSLNITEKRFLQILEAIQSSIDDNESFMLQIEIDHLKRYFEKRDDRDRYQDLRGCIGDIY